MNSFRRNVPLLATAQALMMSVNSLIVTTSALVGALLAEDKSLAALPLAVLFIAVMLAGAPASLLMERIGRRRGFLFSTLLGIAGGALTSLAIVRGEFWWFAGGTFLIGLFNGFGNYYRFAAADAVPESHKSRAVSYVMLGGIAAAFIGPNLANWTREWIHGALFAGSYAVLILLYLLSAVVLSFLKLPSRGSADNSVKNENRRPLKHIITQPMFITALLCGMLGYGVMSLIMTATPLAMHTHMHSFSSTSFVIQWHVLGMFAPSLFTGHLIRRFGELDVMFVGVVLGLACVVINLLGGNVIHFWSALLLLGVSWNFLFIGATSLLTKTYRQAERAKVQALNDVSIFTTVAAASLSAGALQYHLGWQAVNLGVIPLLFLLLFSILMLKQHKTWKTRDNNTGMDVVVCAKQFVEKI